MTKAMRLIVYFSMIFGLGAAGCLGDEDFTYLDGGASGDDDDDDNVPSDDADFEDMQSEEDATKVASDHEGWNQPMCTQDGCHVKYKDDVDVVAKCAACHGGNGAPRNCGQSGSCWTCHATSSTPDHGEEPGKEDSDCLTCHPK